MDDELSIRTLLRDFLSIMKYEVTVAANAEAARAAAERAQDFLICDLRLQGADGCELAKELHAHNPKLAVLMISGQERSAASALPPSFEFLQKPFSLAELDTRMCSMLSRTVAK